MNTAPVPLLGPARFFLGEIEAEWAKRIAPAAHQLSDIDAKLHAAASAGELILPDRQHIFAAFSQPFSQVRVLILGQDPYPTPGHAMGLAFSTSRSVSPIPRSLANIYRELHDDLAIPPASHGDLSAWSEQGVLLLNRVLTVQAGLAGSHNHLGWQEVTSIAIQALARHHGPLVAVLWGKHAASMQPLLGEVACVVSAHPSPLSARNGFFGSKPFSKVNQFLSEQGANPIDWRLPDGLERPNHPGQLF